MSKGKLAIYGTILLPVLVLVAGHFYWTRGVYVRITNDSWTTLENVTVAYRQDVIPLGTLIPKVSRALYVNPVGGSELMLEWCEPSGAKHSYTIDAYGETNYWGSVEIMVWPGNGVSATGEVRLRVIDRSTQNRADLLGKDANAVR